MPIDPAGLIKASRCVNYAECLEIFSDISLLLQAYIREKKCFEVFFSDVSFPRQAYVREKLNIL
jgi:hypothetical protein